MSSDMTAFNGMEPRERDVLPSDPSPGVCKTDPYQNNDNPMSYTVNHGARRILPSQGFTPGTQPPQEFKQRLHLKSLERGYHTKQDPNGRLVERVTRTLWDQEPANRKEVVKGFAAPGPPATKGENPYGGDLVDVPGKRDRLQQLTAANIPQPIINEMMPTDEHVFDFVLEHTLGYQNRPNIMWRRPPNGIYERGVVDAQNRFYAGIEFQNHFYTADEDAGTVPVSAYGAPHQRNVFQESDNGNPAVDAQGNPRTDGEDATYPWLAWTNRPFVSAQELLNVPATSSSQMLRQYKTIGTGLPRNPYDGTGLDNPANAPAANNLKDNNQQTPLARLAEMRTPYGYLLNMLATAALPADVLRNGDVPVLTAASPKGQHVQPYGAPNYFRILDYVQVPSRFVGTDTLLTAEIFNEVPGLNNDTATGGDITGPGDPRYLLQPPYNKVSRQRDPGRVNLNTVTGRREVVNDQGVAISEEGSQRPRYLAPDPYNGVPIVWSDVFDGIMHRDRDQDPVSQQAHGGAAWRDVVLSRKGYAQYNADDPELERPLEKYVENAYPDVFAMGLSPGFPTVFANPFRSSGAGFLVPLPQMKQHGVDASWLRGHPRDRGDGGGTSNRRWGNDDVDDGDRRDNNMDGNRDEPFEPGDPFMNGLVDDAREAGLHRDAISHRFNDLDEYRAVPEEDFGDRDREWVPLFSETSRTSYVDGERNPYMSYQPLTRLGNLVTNRSNVFAVWITVGYFEMERAPSWSDPMVQQRFGGDGNATSAATIAALDIYNRVYPEGYMLGREIGSDTGDIQRHRAFYIIDRTEEVGFKPGEDLNIEKMIRLRRRIE
jgi:hypothetical protein